MDYVGDVIFESIIKLDIGTLSSLKTCLASIATILRVYLEMSKSLDLLNDAVLLASYIPNVRSLAYAILSWMGKDFIYYNTREKRI